MRATVVIARTGTEAVVYLQAYKTDHRSFPSRRLGPKSNTWTGTVGNMASAPEGGTPRKHERGPEGPRA